MNSPQPRRLDPCPCGSGKRYKDCHGSLRAAAQAAREAAELNRRGHERHDAFDLDGAMAAFEAAIARDPLSAEAHYNRGILLLMRRDYAAAWPEYEWRTRLPGYADYAHFAFGMPRWRGEDLAGKSLLVHAEQGQGDTIQFARFIEPLARRGAAIDVFCHPPLAPLMARVRGVRRAMPNLAERPTHDFHAPILDVGAAQLPDASAPHWFGPYVGAQPERVERFARMLSNVRRPRVGIAWKGSPRHANDRNRSLDRDTAMRLRVPEATLVNLQVGEAALGEAMIDAAREIADWDDTAAVVSLLDHVITVDTAVAHLAGAMGRPVTVLVPFVPDWRWGARGETTPWYPGMKLARQARAGDWSEAIELACRQAASRAG